MMKLNAAVAALVAMLAIAPASAAEYVFDVTNMTDTDVVSISVRNGTLTGFSRIAPGGTREMTLTLPDGVCVTRVQVSLDGADGLIHDGYDACNSGGLDLSY